MPSPIAFTLAVGPGVITPIFAGSAKAAAEGSHSTQASTAISSLGPHPTIPDRDEEAGC